MIYMNESSNGFYRGGIFMGRDFFRCIPRGDFHCTFLPRNRYKHGINTFEPLAPVDICCSREEMIERLDNVLEGYYVRTLEVC